MNESFNFDKKSLRLFQSSNPDWKSLAKDCVCFANASGGIIAIGIDDNNDMPPPTQKIDPELISKIIDKVSSLTIAVSIIPKIEIAENGGEFIKVQVQRNISSPASTTDGKYYIRVSNRCNPVRPEDLPRLLEEKSSFTWETQLIRRLTTQDVDESKLHKFVTDIRNSERVSHFVKEKSIPEILDYYLFSINGCLTNLGVLWVGKREDRARLLHAPSIQFIKYDESGEKVSKQVWDDFSLNPKEMIEAVWNDIPDWQEGIEISDGMFRKKVLNYEEVVVRELLANALVHRPYTIRGDIFLNLYHDRLEVHNPGSFPLGVTSSNILHKSVQRNSHLAKVFYDLMLMEKEGSGYDRIYEVLLSNGKNLPQPIDSDDRVVVTIRKRIINTNIVRFMESVSLDYQLNSRELICLGLIAQHNALTSLEIGEILSLTGKENIKSWMGRIVELKLVQTRGRTKATSYSVTPELLVKHRYEGRTNLKKIEPHRLRALLVEDISRYGHSLFGEIHNRIGKEIPERQVRYQLKKLIESRQLTYEGGRKLRKYFIDKT